MKLPGAVKTGVRGLAQMPSPAAATLAKGQAVEDAALTIGGAINEHEEKQARNFLLEQNNNFTRSLAEEDQRLKQQSKNGDEYAKGMETFFEAQKKASIGSAKGGRQINLTEELYDGLKTKHASSIINTTTMMNDAYSEGLVGDAVNIEMNNVYNNPDGMKSSMDMAKGVIESSNLSVARKAELVRGVKSDMRAMQLTSLANTDPTRVMQMLQTEDYTKSMDPKKILTLTNYASNKQSQQEAELIAMTKRADKMAEDQESFIEESTAKTLYEQNASGSLTIDEVFNNRDNLSQADYKYFIGEASGTSTKPVTNIDTYANLYSQATENPQEVKSAAAEALRNKNLTIGDFNKINTLANASMAGDLPTPYKQATSFISRVSRTNELNPPVGAGERYANASDDFNQWFNKNPDVDAVDATNKARDIWSQYQLVESPVVITGIMPYGISKSRNTVTLDDLPAAAKSLQEAYKSRQIDEDEYKRQRNVIGQWKSYLDNKLEKESKK